MFISFRKLAPLLLVLISISGNLHAQSVEKEIDSLKKILALSNQKAKVDLLNQISYKYSYLNKNKLLEFGKKALRIAKNINYKPGQIDALINISYGFYLQNKLDSAIYYSNNALSSIEKNNLIQKAKIENILGLVDWKKGNFDAARKHYKNSLMLSNRSNDEIEKAKSLNYLGLISWIEANYVKSIEFFIESLKLKEQIGNNNETIITLNNIARVYNELKNFKQSINYSSKALELAKSVNDKYSLARALNNLGKSYSALEQYKKALTYLNRAKTIKESVKDSIGLGYVLSDMANCYSKMGNLQKAKMFYEKSLNLRRKVDGPFATANSLIHLANVNLELDEYGQMLKHLTEGIKLAKQNNVNELLMDGYKIYSAYFEKNGNFKKAFFYHKKYDDLKDNIYSKDANKLIAEMQIKYDSDTKQKENQLLRKQNEIKKLQLAHQTNVIKFIIAVAVLGLILVLVIYGRYRSRQKANELLKEKNKELEEKNKLILQHQTKLDETLEELKNEVLERKKYAQQLIAAKNKAEEANKLKSEFLAGISHEIRTPINTVLNYVSLLKEDLLKENKTEFLEYFEAIEIGSRRLIRTIDSILNMSQFQSGEFEVFKEKVDLYQDVLLGVYKEFKQHADQKGLELKLTNRIKKSVIWADQYTLSQLFSNLVDNAIKYTESGRIEILLKSDDEKNVYVEIEDTGIGISEEFLPELFEPFQQEEMGYTRAFEGNGLGLALVKKYVEINKGTIKVQSVKGKGTKFTVTLPKNRIENMVHSS